MMSRTAALWLGLFGLLVIVLLRRITDDDIWFHLVVGREVAALGAVPAREFYVGPLLGQPGAFHEWGFGLLYHMVERGFGLGAMAAVNAALGAATVLLLSRAAGAGQPWPSALAAMAVTVAALEFRLVYRPETLLFVALAAEILVLERFAAGGGWRQLAALPAVAWLLAQGHPSPAILIIVLLAYAAQMLWDAAPRRRSRLALGLAALIAATALAAMLNPYGPAQLLLPFQFAANAALLDGLVEFLPALATDYRWHFLALSAAGAAAVALGPRRRLVDGLLLLAFAILAYRHVRNIALLAVVLHVPIARALAEIWRGRLGAIAPRRSGLAAALLAVAAMMAQPLIRGDWGAGVMPTAFPERAVARLRALPPIGVINFFHLGSYLAWALGRGATVFVDGRNFGYNEAVRLHDAVFRADPGWRAVVARFGGAAILTPATLDYSGGLIPLVAELAEDPAWVLAEAEPAGLLFLRRGLATAVIDKRRVWEQVVTEAEATAAAYPRHTGPWAALAEAYHRLGQAERAASARRILARLRQAG